MSDFLQTQEMKDTEMMGSWKKSLFEKNQDVQDLLMLMLL